MRKCGSGTCHTGYAAIRILRPYLRKELARTIKCFDQYCNQHSEGHNNLLNTHWQLQAVYRTVKLYYLKVVRHIIWQCSDKVHIYSFFNTTVPRRARALKETISNLRHTCLNNR